MSTPRTDPNLSIMRPYFDDLASSLPDPERGLADVLTRVAVTPQARRRWPFSRPATAPSSPPSPIPQPATMPATKGHVPVSTGRFQSMFSATKVIVASVIVALFGGVLVVSTLTQQPSDGLPAAGVSTTAAAAEGEATEAPTPSQQAPPVADERSGVLETQVGPFEWIRVEDADLPSVFRRGLPDVMPWHDGTFALVNRGSSQVWVSDDGTDWRSRSLPSLVGQDTGQLVHADGVSWLIGESGGTNPNPPRIWRSLDGESWQEIDAGSWILPGPAGLVWESGLSDIASIGDLMVGIESPRARFPTRRLGVPVKCHDERLEKRGLRLYEVVFGAGGPKPNCQDGRTLLRFVEKDGGLVVKDDASGRSYGRIAGAALSDIDRFAGGPFSEYETRIVALDDAGVTLVDPPFAAQRATLFAAGDSVYAYVSQPMSVWRTSDGISWTDLGSPDLPGGIPQGSEPRAQSRAGGMTLVAYERRDGHSAIAAAWDTVDGVTWEPMPTGWPEGTEPVRLDSGWFATEFIDGRHGPERGDSIWMHAGGEWVSLAELGLDCADSAGSSEVSMHAAGSTTLLRTQPGCREDASEEVWVLKPMSSG